MREVWRGWQGHFICPCRWHLNTLVEHNGVKVIISTVGINEHISVDGFKLKRELVTVCGNDGYFETMVFGSDESSWDDPDVSLILHDYTRRYPNEEMTAQNGHYQILEDVKLALQDGSLERILEKKKEALRYDENW